MKNISTVIGYNNEKLVSKAVITDAPREVCDDAAKQFGVEIFHTQEADVHIVFGLHSDVLGYLVEIGEND